MANAHIRSYYISHHSGQMCTAASRIYVQEGIYDRFLEAFAAAANAIKVGDGFSGDCDQGPLVSEVQLKVSHMPAPLR